MKYTIKELRKIISGSVILYRPLEKAPYWEPVLASDSMYDLEDDFDDISIHHIEPGYDHWGDPCIGLYLDMEEM